MDPDTVRYSEARELPLEQAIALYRANDWPSADKPEPNSDVPFTRTFAIQAVCHRSGLSPRRPAGGLRVIGISNTGPDWA